MPLAAPPATEYVPKQSRSHSPGCAPSPSCKTSPASELRELEVVALAVHPHSYVPNPSPGVQPGAQGPECAVVRGQRAPGESHGCTKELATFVEHSYSIV